jgi:hypothetical protein
MHHPTGKTLFQALSLKDDIKKKDLHQGKDLDTEKHPDKAPDKGTQSMNEIEPTGGNTNLP